MVVDDPESIDRLKSEGWVERFTASGPRLREAVENYRMLGFEVKTVPVKELERGGCTVCFDDESDDTQMIFTRERRS
jgi:hypothetical protein